MLKSFVDNLKELDFNGLRVDLKIINNGSSDKRYLNFKNLKLPKIAIHYFDNDKNLGFAAGNNIGIKKSQDSDYLFFVNDDVFLSKNTLKNLLNFLEENKNCGLVSPKIYFAKGYEFHKDRYKKNDLGKVIWYAGGEIDWKNIHTDHLGVDVVDRGQFEKIQETELISGACFLARNEVFKKLAGFEEKYFLYWEDADLSIRARMAGFGVYFNPKAHCWHKVSVSAGGSGSLSNDYFLIRNRYFFAMRYASFRTKLAVFKDTLRLMFFGRPWQKIGARDALFGIMGRGSWLG